MAFEIVTAERKSIPALIGIWGPSNGGKTLSALRIARGLAGPDGKIVVVDTENERAKNYSDYLDVKWQHLDFQPPFSPERYIEAMDAAEAAGASVIIFDSMSHVWEGEGGVLEMADAATSSGGRALQGLAKWNKPKMAYKRMLNALLRSRVHVIFCLRAKDLNSQRGRGQDSEIEYLGLAPICEKNFIYEMTVAFLIGPDHKPVPHSTERLRVASSVPCFKVPEALLGKINPSEYLSEKTGEVIAEWIGGGKPVDQAFEELKRAARNEATNGWASMTNWWQARSKQEQKQLAPILEELRTTAASADRAETEKTREEQPSQGDPLNDAFTTKPEDQPAAAAAE